MYVELGVAIDTAICAADEYDGGYNFERDMKIRDALMALPTVDAVPVRHGRWINEGVYGEGHSQCSIRCSNPLCNFHYIGYLDDYNYCPNCGTKMDGKGNGDETD